MLQRFYNKVIKRKIKPQVSVIIPTYNAESTIEKCLRSVINQSIGFEKLEIIIVDDCSNDSTQDIIRKFSKEYSNIRSVFLETNSGGAGTPRNTGLDLVAAEYVMFLDSDDWLDKFGIESLLVKAKRNNLDFVVGRTIMVRENKKTIHAEFMSYKEIEKVKPTELPYLFYHLGPPSKLIKTEVISKNKIMFPKLNFAEDKFFFSMVIGLSKSVGMTKDVIYYVNRNIENKETLTATVSLLDKRKADLYTYNKLMSSRLNRDIKEVLSKRFLEYDFIRSCNSKVFEELKDKVEYIDIVKRAFLIRQKDKRKIVGSFDSELYKLAVTLLFHAPSEKFVSYMHWVRRTKKVNYDKVTAYYELPKEFIFKKNAVLEVNFIARAAESISNGDVIYQKFTTKGKLADSVSSVILRDRENPLNEYEMKLIKIKRNEYVFKMDRKTLENASAGYYHLFVRYGEYKLANIKNDAELLGKGRKYKIYTSKHDNLTFSIN